MQYRLEETGVFPSVENIFDFIDNSYVVANSDCHDLIPNFGLVPVMAHRTVRVVMESNVLPDVVDLLNLTIACKGEGRIMDAGLYSDMVRHIESELKEFVHIGLIFRNWKDQWEVAG